MSIYSVGGGITRQISSLDIVKDYSDYELWLTLADHNLAGVYEYLVNVCNIPCDKIKFFGDREYRLGCAELQSGIYIRADSVRVCCVEHYKKEFYMQVVTRENIVSKLDEVESWRQNMIDSLRKGKKTRCDGCPNLRKGIYPAKSNVNYMVILAGEKRCNARCFYCNQYHTMKDSGIEGLGYYDYHKMGADYYKKIRYVTFVAGEPTLIKDIDKTMILAKENGWICAFHTNGILYSDDVAQVISENADSSINVSLDSGTADTYRRIKRVDTFNRVLENLHKYRYKRCNIRLKYILLPEYNDNYADINGFIRIAKDLKSSCIILSQNLINMNDGKMKNTDADTGMSEEKFRWFIYMITRIKEEGLNWSIETTNFSKVDVDRFDLLR